MQAAWGSVRDNIRACRHSERRNRHSQQHPLPIRSSAEGLAEASAPTMLLLILEGVNHLAELQLDRGRVAIFTDDTSQNVKSLFVTALVCQPSRRFRDDQQDEEYKTGKRTLQQARKSPGPGRRFQCESLVDMVFNFGPSMFHLPGVTKHAREEGLTPRETPVARKDPIAQHVKNNPRAKARTSGGVVSLTKAPAEV